MTNNISKLSASLHAIFQRNSPFTYRPRHNIDRLRQTPSSALRVLFSSHNKTLFSPFNFVGEQNEDIARLFRIMVLYSMSEQKKILRYLYIKIGFNFKCGRYFLYKQNMLCTSRCLNAEDCVPYSTFPDEEGSATPQYYAAGTQRTPAFRKSVILDHTNATHGWSSSRYFSCRLFCWWPWDSSSQSSNVFKIFWNHIILIMLKLIS